MHHTDQLLLLLINRLLLLEGDNESLFEDIPNMLSSKLRSCQANDNLLKVFLVADILQDLFILDNEAFYLLNKCELLVQSPLFSVFNQSSVQYEHSYFMDFQFIKVLVGSLIEDGKDLIVHLVGYCLKELQADRDELGLKVE